MLVARLTLAKSFTTGAQLFLYPAVALCSEKSTCQTDGIIFLQRRTTVSKFLENSYIFVNIYPG